MQVFTNILNQVNLLIKKSAEISRLKGEGFNIFSVLHIETQEVTTHNRLITELLNPSGSHNMGEVFLHLFYNQLIQSSLCNLSDEKKRVLENIRNSNATVVAEHWLGYKDLENIEGGSIDICIQTNKGQIRIENKINAGDQEMQIARYCSNHNEENNIIIYLTKDGNEPTEDSKLELSSGEDFFLLSHKEDTISWLQVCFEKAIDYPILRETLKQYIILLKKITNQHTTHEMNEELLDLITSNKENYQAAEEIASSFKKAQERTMAIILSEIKKKLSLKGTNSFDIGRSNRQDGAFITIKNIVIASVSYDVGLNLELENEYFFFCIVEENKKRSASINTKPIFDKVANYLSNTEYSITRTGNKCGWRLNSLFLLENEFSLNKYLQLGSEERNVYIDEIVHKITMVINESKLVDYNEE